MVISTAQLPLVDADLTEDVCQRATSARDPRFDGLFFVGITTTRVYCRPVCPARVSYPDRRRFFSSAAAAERAGFRPCLRCRPELAPGRAIMDALPRLAHVAERRIAAGALNGRTMAEFAQELGVSERHLRRAFERWIGASPIELAQTHRLLLAKRLLADTSLPVTQVAYASGFQSLRRFNTAFRDTYRLPPSGVRRPTASQRVIRARPDGEPLGAMLRLTLAYRPPFAWDTLLDWLGWDALGGVEAVTGRRYARTVLVEGRSGIVQAEDASGATLDSGGDREAAPVMRNHVRVEVSQSLVPVLMPLLSRLRQLFDLDAEPAVVDAHLAAGGLSGLIKRRPGLRIPGAIDGFDVALRILLRGCAWWPPLPRDPDLADRVVWALGEPIETGRPDLSRLAPNAERVAEAGSDRLVGLGVPRHRAEAAIALARLVADNRLRLELGGDPGVARELLADATGADDRSLSAIMLRTLGWPDAFPVLDPALQRAAGVLGVPALQARAEQWRPWRGYAALHLWLHHIETRNAAASSGVVAANGARDLGRPR